MTNPCIEYCYIKYGRRYTTSCDTVCEFARIAKENRELRAIIERLTAGRDKDNAQKAYCASTSIQCSFCQPGPCEHRREL